MTTAIRTILACVVATVLWPSAWGQSAFGQQPAYGTNLDQLMPIERQDFGVPPTRQLHSGAMHGPTPATIPGAQVVTTKGLSALMQSNQVPYLLFDVLGQTETLPNAIAAAWLAQPGTFNDPIQHQFSQLLAQGTQGRKDTALVFYCLSRECWMSYNAALRAINAGYSNVLWYRGGIEAWKAAGLPTTMAQQGSATRHDGNMPPREFPQQQSGAYPQQQSGAYPQQQSGAYPQQQFPQQPSGAVPNQGGMAQPTFVPIQPQVARSVGAGNGSRPVGELQIGRSRFFSFALPPGWRIGEDAQYALTLMSPDNSALTVMVGVAGMQLGYPAARFAYEKLSTMRSQNLQLGDPRPGRPVTGFAQAQEFDVSYNAQGIAYRGVAKVSVAPAYDTATMAMTASLAPTEQWASYATWLPQVADQISANNGAAFGARGVMQQNLQNSTAFAESARQYRDWSQKNWQGVVDQRNASVDRQNFAFRENLGGVQTFSNPYGTTAPMELPLTYKYFWTDRQGRVQGTNDPSGDPNVGSTGEWRRMERVVR